MALVPGSELMAAGGRSAGGSTGGHGGHGGGGGGTRSASMGFHGAPGAVMRGNITRGGDPRTFRAFSSTREDHRRHDRFHRHFDGAVPFAVYSDYPYYPYYNSPYYGYGYSSQYYEVPMSYAEGNSSYDSGEISVTDVQSELARKGYYQGPVDGIMGPMTRQAITDFQRDYDLRPSGRITPALLGRLGLR